MDVSVQVEDLEGGRWAVARVAGELDLASAPALRERLIASLTAGRLHLILDLTEVDFLDSTGLGVIVGVLKRARTLGGDLRLVCPNTSVRRVFEITALDRTFSLADTVEEALAQETDGAG